MDIPDFTVVIPLTSIMIPTARRASVDNGNYFFYGGIRFGNSAGR